MNNTDKLHKKKGKHANLNEDEVYDEIEKKIKRSKVEKKSTNTKTNTIEYNLNIHNNIFLRLMKENKEKYEKIDNIEKIYRKLKSDIISLNISYVQIEHYDSFFYYEKNKIDFILPELDNIINSSNIDILKDLCDISFYPIYNTTLSKRIIEWLTKDRNNNDKKEYTEGVNMSYLFSLNILLSYLIYKNDDNSNYSCLIYLNMLHWMQNDKKILKFRLFILKGILKRFLFCCSYFNDKEILKLKKIENDSVIDESKLHVLKNIFLTLHSSVEYIDISNLLNINDKNCIFELIKFFIELIKKPLIYSLHILCVNYLIKIVKSCYDFRFTYNINWELYDIGPEVNIFVKIINLILAKILSVIKDTKNEENMFCLEEINNINNLITLFFINILNNCVRIIIPQVLINDKLKKQYLLNNENKYNREGNTNMDDITFEDEVVLNACNPIFSFIEIFIINHSDKYEKNVFIELIKILIKECRKIEKRYNIMKMISDEYILFIKDGDSKRKHDKSIDANYIKSRKVSRKRFDSNASFKLSDEYSSSIYSETEDEDKNEDEVHKNGIKNITNNQKEINVNDDDNITNKVSNEETNRISMKDNTNMNKDDIVSSKKEEEIKSKETSQEKDDPSEINKHPKKKVYRNNFINKLNYKRKGTFLVDNKTYYITYESVMVRYLNLLLKYMNCERYQIRNTMLDLFLSLIKKKRTNKNESIFQSLFKLFLERLEDPNVIVKAKALSILVTLTNKKYYDNSLIYKFIFNKMNEKINMYKIISCNIYSNRSNIRKLIIIYIEAIFEALIHKKLNYKIYFFFVYNYLCTLSLDAMSSVRRQVLLTVNNLFINASHDFHITKIWIAIIFSSITDIEETIKDECISIFLNTFIKPALSSSLLNINENKIKQVLKKYNITYFKINQELVEKIGRKYLNDIPRKYECNDVSNKVHIISTSDDINNNNFKNEDNIECNNEEDNNYGNINMDNIMEEKKNKNMKKQSDEEYDRNNDGILYLIHLFGIYFENDLNNTFICILKYMTKYDLLHFNIIISCLKKKKNNTLEDFINLLNSFLYNMRYFSIKVLNTFILDFIIQLSKEYQKKIKFENVLFLLNRCYEIYLMNINNMNNERNMELYNNKYKTLSLIKSNDKINHIEKNDNDNNNLIHNDNKMSKVVLNDNIEGKENKNLIDYILSDEDLIYEKEICTNGILKNILLKLFTILYNLLDSTEEELDESFLFKMENTIYHFNCPICFIYIILNIIRKKKKNINDFIEKLKNKIVYFFEHIETIELNNIFCNILITFIFLINDFKKGDTFLNMVCTKLKKIYENIDNIEMNTTITTNTDSSSSSSNNNNIMIKNCIYLTQSILVIDKSVSIRNELFLNFEKDLKNVNTCMNILNNLIILIYYMIINFGSSCNKFVFVLLRFFKHDNSFLRYLSFYVLSKLLSEDYIKYNNQFFFGVLYLLADKNEIIRKQSLSVFKHILMMYSNKNNIINYIIECIFVLNNFYNFKLSKHLIHIGNIFHINNNIDRYKIYSYLLENLSNSEKFSLQQKLINEYLIQYVYNYDNYYFEEDDIINEKNKIKNKTILPLNDEDNEGSVLLDVLNILSCKLMKIKIKKDFAPKLEEKNKNIRIKNVENSVKVLNDLMKNILKKNTLPILLSLRTIMFKTKSFFFKYINNLIIYLCIDYKDSIDELINETHLRNEIIIDFQNFIYIDSILLHAEQYNHLLFDKNKNININFLEHSENIFDTQRNHQQNKDKNNKKKKKFFHIIDNNHNDINHKEKNNYDSSYTSSDEYEQVEKVLHGISSDNDEYAQKGKKKKKKKKLKHKGI
ncbi:conserved Plasmodium protein, unknown function [Plasmodium gaboni]|uniref:Condensin-2 complex subunit D3 n=1 Tax=Plasmodium gaboni TaxID=647221 RepID=A0ABY1UQE2_9APIC|nr:conserved Plasmodium protein, unknown function [Plasmodium gaboni]